MNIVKAFLESKHRGIASGISAYFIWGIIPIYWRLLKSIPATELILYRVLFSAVTTFLFVLFFQKLKILIKAVKDKSNLWKYSLSAFLIAINWFIYIYAVLTNRTIQASLGYYLCPIFVVLLGNFVFKEKISKSTLLSLVIISIGIIFQIISIGEFPWIAISLASSFALYGLVKKFSKLDAFIGLTLETQILLPFSIVGLYFMNMNQQIHIYSSSLYVLILIIISGLVTSLPLMFYGDAVRHCKFSTVGVLQYIAPTLQFLSGWLLFNEQVTIKTVIVFLIVVFGLIIFCLQPLEKINVFKIKRNSSLY